MLDTIIATRYAKALLQSCGSDRKLNEIKQNFDSFITIYSNDGKLYRVLTSPVFSPNNKKNILREIAEKTKYSAIFTKFLVFLSEKGRLKILDSIHIEFLAKIDEKNGISRARIFYADEVPKKDLTLIEKELVRITGNEVKIDTYNDPSLIGGIKVQIGGVIYDGSIKNKLEMMRNKLTGD